MSIISSQLVKELREKSGAGMMDCKKALTEVAGDIEAAIDWLRKKGLAAAAKKSGRIAADGLVGVCQQSICAAVVEINAETDFVARNPDFQKLVLNVAHIACNGVDNLEALQAAPYGNGKSVQEEITSLITVIGENLSLRKVNRLKVSNGVVASYVHGAIAPNLGRIGVLVALESTADKSILNELGKKIAMHIAATSPQALNIEAVDPSAVERERAVLTDQAKASGRPDDVIAKMVEGRIRKYYEETVLLEQIFVMDGKTKISDVIQNASKEINTPIQLTAFSRFTLGEGIKKQESDFAAEVKAQANIA